MTVPGRSGGTKSAHRSKKARSGLGSARASRAGDGVLAITNFCERVQPVALECVDGISAGRRNVRAGRPRSPIGITSFPLSPADHALTAFAFVLSDWNGAAQPNAAFGGSNLNSLSSREH